MISDDPFPPSPPEISMHIPEVLPPIKYPDFSELHHQEKLEILTDAMLIRDPSEGIEVMFRDYGITQEQYKDIIANPEYVKLLRDKSTREKFAPFIPTIFETLGREAANGDDSKLKAALQTIGTLAPDNSVFINQNIQKMTDEELALETEKLLLELKDE